MKKIHIAGKLLQCFLLAGLLTGCQNEDVLTPVETIANVSDDQNAKIAGEIRLVKDGEKTIQYHKSGRFAGLVSKVSEQYYYTTYSYVDGALPGAYSITSKLYLKGNDALIKEMHYDVNEDGVCTKSHDVTSNQISNFTYKSRTRLEKITREGSSEKIEFLYTLDQTTGKYRLQKCIYSNINGAYKQITFFYDLGVGTSTKLDKYALNNEHTYLDKYLPVFGKFSDVLVQSAQITPLPYTNQTRPYYEYYYLMNANGYPISSDKHSYPLGYGNNAGKQTTLTVFQFSTQWMGL